MYHFQVNLYHLGIFWINVNPFNTKQIFVMLNQYGIYQSLDKGNSWKNIVSNLTCYRSVFNPLFNDGLFYVTCSDGLFVYDSIKKQWNDISPMKTMNGYQGIDISRDDTVIVVA